MKTKFDIGDKIVPVKIKKETIYLPTENCAACSGIGKVILQDSNTHECPCCNGLGKYQVKAFTESYYTVGLKSINRIYIDSDGIDYFVEQDGYCNENLCFETIKQADDFCKSTNKFMDRQSVKLPSVKEYKGYIGTANYSRINNIYFGCVLHTKIYYESKTYANLQKVFEKAVDKYLKERN